MHFVDKFSYFRIPLDFPLPTIADSQRVILFASLPGPCGDLANYFNMEARMKLLGCLAVLMMLAGCGSGNGTYVAGTVANSVISAALSQSGGYGYGGRNLGAAGRIPNTPECRRYLNYARTSGAMGTYGPLVRHYNACLNSKKSSAASKKLRCAPGKYYHWYDGVRRCR